MTTQLAVLPPVSLGRIRRAGWVRVTYGVHRPLGLAGERLADLASWQQVLPNSGTFTHLTGAMVRGWWLPPLPAELPVFAGIMDSEPRPRRPGLVVCRHTQRIDWDPVAGLRVATPPEILLASARDLGLLDLVVLADAALSLGHCTLNDLRQAAAQRRRGAPALRRALPYVDARSESAWESVLRLLFLVCDVPVQAQYDVRDRDGIVRARADLRILGTRRLPEYDGEVHRDPRRHAQDLIRDRLLLRLGWQRLGYTSGVLLHNAGSVLREADEALGRVNRPERVRIWHQLLVRSLFTPAGAARLRARWEGR